MTCTGDHHWMEVNTIEGWFRQCINLDCGVKEQQIDGSWVTTFKQWLP